MSGTPDPKPERRPRPGERRRTRQDGLLGECWGGCGRRGENSHHLIPRDWTKPGPDEPWNLISLCGTGTSGCHGAYHGSPYVDAAGKRYDQAIVARAILARLYTPAETWRLSDLYAFLETDELVYRFFTRQLRAASVEITSSFLGGRDVMVQQ